MSHASFAKAHPFVEDFYTPAHKEDERRSFTRFLVGGIACAIATLAMKAAADR